MIKEYHKPSAMKILGLLRLTPSFRAVQLASTTSIENAPAKLISIKHVDGRGELRTKSFACANVVESSICRLKY